MYQTKHTANWVLVSKLLLKIGFFSILYVNINIELHNSCLENRYVEEATIDLQFGTAILQNRFTKSALTWYRKLTWESAQD